LAKLNANFLPVGGGGFEGERRAEEHIE